MTNYVLYHRHDEADCEAAFEALKREQHRIADAKVLRDETTCGCPHGHHWGVLFFEAEDPEAANAMAKAIGVGETRIEPVEYVAWPLA